MDIATFNRAKQAYAAQNWESAVILFSQCGTGPGTGEACHLCGNALMRLGRVQEAVQAYRAAAADTEYRNQGAVYTNLGKAQMALGDLRGAADSLRHALNDASYQGAYKAYIALGEVYSKLGDARNAGVAFRKAALEENNPDPAKSLINLGVCFMQLRRPADAAEAYRTALDFSTSDQERDLLNANLGQAYVASNRMLEAVQAFEAAMAGGYRLSPAANADYQRALQATNAAAGTRGAVPSQGRQNMTAGAYDGGGYDPLDPTGNSGEMLPSPDNSGFFMMPENEMGAYAGPAERGSRHVGLKVAIVVIALALVAVGCGVFAYMRGFGVPSQEAAVEGVFDAAGEGADASRWWSSSVGAGARAQAMAAVEAGRSYKITGMDVSTDECVAVVEATLSEGGTVTYTVSLVREGLGWMVSNIERVRSSVADGTFAGALSDPVSAATPVADEPQQAVEDAGQEGAEGGDAQAAW